MPSSAATPTSSVTIEDDAYIAAGSTITKTAPKGKLSIARARQTVIESWHDKRDE